jgi:Icc-related predicted phosphoesterase
MRIVAISDTHTMERNFQIPDGDVLVHCGDFTYKGRQEEITDFLDWFLDLPHKNKILIAGNHDVTLEKNHREDIVSLLEIEDSEHWIHECFFKRVIESGAHYLENSGVTIDGVNFWGSPVTPTFGIGWAFNEDRGAMIASTWEKIPDDTDVLITHGPPRNMRDWVKYNNSGNQGCFNLLDRISAVKPKLSLFGHIHEGYGSAQYKETLFINCSLLDDEYYPVNYPWVIDLENGEIVEYTNRI